MTRLLSLLLVALALASCRDALTGPDATPDPIHEPSDVRAMYVKAPAVLLEGEVVDVRAEPIPGATLYVWSPTGPGEVAFTPNDPYGRSRIMNATGIAAGPLRIVARAYDGAGNLIAEGTKVSEVLHQ